MVKWLKRIALLFVLVVLGFMAFIRFAPHPAADWHGDPMAIADPTTPNWFRVLPAGSPAPAADTAMVAPVYAVPAPKLAEAFDAMALAHPATTRLGGSPAEGVMSYVQRTPLLGYPDTLSVKVIDLGDGRSTLAILSRSRFGQSDMGVNRARVQAWLEALPVPPAQP